MEKNEMGDLKFPDQQDELKKLTVDEKKQMRNYVDDIYERKKRQLESIYESEWEDYWRKTKEDEIQKIIKENKLDKIIEEYNRLHDEFKRIYNSSRSSSRYENLNGIVEPKQFEDGKLEAKNLVEIEEKIPEKYNHDKKRYEPDYDKNVYGRAKKQFLDNSPANKRLE